MPRTSIPVVPATRMDGFDVTAVVGRVDYGEGQESAYHAAMTVIADDSSGFSHDQKRTYHFPGVTVTVKFDPENVGAMIDNYADMDD